MSAHHDPDLDERALEGLLRGRVPPGREDLEPVAGLMSDLRELGSDPAPAPSAALAALMADERVDDLPFEEGLVPEPVSTETTPRRRRGVAWPRLRGAPRMITGLLSTLAAKVGALGLAGKAALALTTAGAVAGGAAATDLPDAVAAALDRDRGAEEVSVPASDPEPEAAEFGQGVADDATDPEDPGVDGPDVADEARERAEQRRQDDGQGAEGLSDGEETGPPEENPASEASSEGRERARENTEATPAKVPEKVGPDHAEERRGSDEPEAASDGEEVGPPPERPAGPPEETPANEEAGDTPAGPPEETPANGNGRSR